MSKSVACAAAVLVCGLAVLPGARAHAQHGTSGYGVVPMNPHDSVLLESQVAGFELPGRAGVWQTLSVRLEHALARSVSVTLRPSLARIEYDDGSTVLGPGDTEVAVKVLAYERFAPHTTLSLGLSGELPTGDADAGTGNGHVSLLPFAVFMVMPSKEVMLHVMAADRVVLGETDHAADDSHAGHVGHAAAAHGSVIMPHSNHEFVVHGGACFTLDWFVISPSLELMQVLSPGSDTFLNAQLELAVVPRRELRLAAGLDVSLLEDPRYEWRSRLMAAWLW
jgi:hypothetical protein